MRRSTRGCSGRKMGLDNSPTEYNLMPSGSFEGALMRRHGSGAGCGARGLEETHLKRSGGAGTPPGGTKTSREELADGACSCLAKARKSPMLRKGSRSEGRGQAESRRKRGPAAVKTPPWRAERRRASATMHARKETVAPLGAPLPRQRMSGLPDMRERGVEGQEEDGRTRRLPNNAGGEALAKLAHRAGMTEVWKPEEDRN